MRIGGQVRRIAPTLALVLGASIGLLVASVLAARWAGVPIEWLMRDPLATLEADPLVGAMSNLGIVVWSAAAGACLLAALALRRRGDDRESASFFLWSGVLTVVLVLDDLYQFHEQIGPVSLHLAQRGIYLVYLAAVVTYLFRFRRRILATDWLILVLAGIAFAVSIGVDLLPETLRDGVLAPVEDLVEDGAKFVGIVLWSTYFTREAAAALGRGAASAPQPRSAPDAPRVR